MYLILGATGHVGSAVAENLLRANLDVTVISRSRDKAALLSSIGAHSAIVDVHDVAGLRSAFSKAKRLFLLNPPADPGGNTIQAERESLHAILAALERSGIEKIVAESTYGAQPGAGAGDLNVLFEMEQGLRKLGIPFTVLRAAYYMSNWDASLQTALEEGKVYSFYPPQFMLPMAAPADLGRVAAKLLQQAPGQHGTHYVEGPERYSPADVASAFARALGRSVSAVEIPRGRWIPEMTGRMGFSQAAAESMAKMTALTIVQQDQFPTAPERGVITLDEYVADLVRRNDEVPKMSGTAG